MTKTDMTANPKPALYGCVRLQPDDKYTLYLGAQCVADSREAAMEHFAATFDKTRKHGWRAVLLQDDGHPVISDLKIIRALALA